MNICFDIDGVLANFVDPFLQDYVSPYVNKELTSDSMSDFKFYKSFDFSDKQEAEWFNKAREEGIFARLPPYDNGFIDFIKNNKEHTIFFNTHRSKRAIEQTYEWFMNNHIPFCNGIYFTPMDRTPTKGDMAKYLGVNIFVEDCYEVAKEISNGVDVVLLVDRPWNKKHTVLPHNMFRVHNATDLENIINRLESERK